MEILIGHGWWLINACAGTRLTESSVGISPDADT